MIEAIHEIVALVAERTRIPIHEIMSRRKNAAIVSARHTAIVLAYQHCGALHPSEIGAVFGMDRTTVTFACGNLVRRLRRGKVDPDIVEELADRARHIAVQHGVSYPRQLKGLRMSRGDYDQFSVNGAILPKASVVDLLIHLYRRLPESDHAAKRRAWTAQVSPSTFRRWMAGDQNMPSRVIPLVAAELGLEVKPTMRGG